MGNTKKNTYTTHTKTNEKTKTTKHNKQNYKINNN